MSVHSRNTLENESLRVKNNGITVATVISRKANKHHINLGKKVYGSFCLLTHGA